MKRIKILIFTVAFTVGILAALALRQKQGCLNTPQYYYNGRSYLAAGILGENYICVNGSGTCTYYGGNGTFEPCQSGIYTPFAAKGKGIK